MHVSCPLRRSERRTLHIHAVSNTNIAASQIVLLTLLHTPVNVCNYISYESTTQIVLKGR
jgi:hypothetical protein